VRETGNVTAPVRERRYSNREISGTPTVNFKGLKYSIASFLQSHALKRPSLMRESNTGVQRLLPSIIPRLAYGKSLFKRPKSFILGYGLSGRREVCVFDNERCCIPAKLFTTFKEQVFRTIYYVALDILKSLNYHQKNGTLAKTKSIFR
jgi:hypothetical protein